MHGLCWWSDRSHAPVKVGGISGLPSGIRMFPASSTPQHMEAHTVPIIRTTTTKHRTQAKCPYLRNWRAEWATTVLRNFGENEWSNGCTAHASVSSLLTPHPCIAAQAANSTQTTSYRMNTNRGHNRQTLRPQFIYAYRPKGPPRWSVPRVMTPASGARASGVYRDCHRDFEVSLLQKFDPT